VTPRRFELVAATVMVLGALAVVGGALVVYWGHL
jgi:hypothetical protein